MRAGFHRAPFHRAQRLEVEPERPGVTFTPITERTWHTEFRGWYAYWLECGHGGVAFGAARVNTKKQCRLCAQRPRRAA